MRNPKLYLKDILESMEAIRNFIEGMDFDDFKNSDLVSSAVLRKLEIIGEASKKIPQDIKSKYSNVPWKAMAGMRDRLIHFYFGVKKDLVWATIKTEIPKIKPIIERILEEIEDT